MATRRKKPAPTELTGTEDPGAPLDGAALLAAAKPLLKALAADLLARADESSAVTEALQARHAQEQKAERTADAYPEWRRALVEQVAAAWLLSCVFVRTLEDRGLLGRSRIAGPGAQDSWKAFLQLAPSLSEREYLLTVFRELARLPAAADLFDARHNPVWLLAPSAEGARNLLNLFRSPNADAPTFRFGGDDTRFLGDLYQDLSEDVRKRYALLQTPRFVESFILDRTLEPAIERFGLDDTNLIDPTCGSGHFLLGAFERLFDHRLRAEPGLSPREAATKALNAVAGSDINPYAIAIARFRLTLAFIEKCGVTRLKDVPRLPLHLAVADSLLYNPQIGQLALVEGTDPSKWEGAHFSLEDPKAARDVLFKQYAAVVGNPPYITVKDPVLRERYRSYYVSAAGKYSLAAPFAERFFQLARDAGTVGMITANSFMKREFGKRLIEEYLRTVNLNLIINTSGAYIPGHGTPTVLLFGTCEKPKGTDVLTVLASRGEPTTPENAEQGLVWSSVAQHWSEVGFENDYISVARVERTSLAKHPWSLGGGGAGDLKDLLEERAECRLGELTTSIGISCVTGEDEVYLLPPAAALRRSVGRTRPLVTGEYVRDWTLAAAGECVFPYDQAMSVLPTEHAASELRYLWPFRAVLSKRKRFGTPMLERGLTWYELQELYADKLRTPLTITFAFVATHNHFVLDRGGKVFNRSAPIIKLPETATEDDHLALLAYLNSSTACFWMKQVFFPKYGAVKADHPDPARNFYEFAGTGLKELPIPPFGEDVRAGLIYCARALNALGERRAKLLSPDELSGAIAKEPDVIAGERLLAESWRAADRLRRRMVLLQEETDWLVYAAFGLCEAASANADLDYLAECELSRGQRAFEPVSGRLSLVRHGGQLVPAETAEVETAPTTSLGERQIDLLARRRAETAASPQLSMLEQAVHKRLWRDTEANVTESNFRKDHDREVLRLAFCELVEYRVKIERRTTTWRRLFVDDAVESVLLAICRENDQNPDDLIRQQSVPFLSAYRYSSKGLEVRERWLETWQAQRAEDERGAPGAIQVPPKYGQDDFASSTIWSLRGKLDVPKERFISYPGCESDENKEPVYGWAGWDYLQRAVALAGLYQDRKQREGWTKDRLQPMLAGLLELLPWLKQWHHEPSAELGGERPSDQFEAFLNAECSEFGFTSDDLRAWRPTAKVRGGGKAKKRKSEADMAEGEDV
jgi:N-6 DNA Methylase